MAPKTRTFVMMVFTMVAGFLITTGVMIHLALQGNIEWWMAAAVSGAMLVGDTVMLAVLAVTLLKERN